MSKVKSKCTHKVVWYAFVEWVDLSIRVLQLRDHDCLHCERLGRGHINVEFTDMKRWLSTTRIWTDRSAPHPVSRLEVYDITISPFSSVQCFVEEVRVLVLHSRIAGTCHDANSAFSHKSPRSLSMTSCRTYVFARARELYWDTDTLVRGDGKQVHLKRR